VPWEDREVIEKSIVGLTGNTYVRTYTCPIKQSVKLAFFAVAKEVIVILVAVVVFFRCLVHGL